MTLGRKHMCGQTVTVSFKLVILRSPKKLTLLYGGFSEYHK